MGEGISRPRRLRQRGQAGIFVALTVPVLFGVLGMVSDIGWAYWRREAARTAAQAAAMAVVSAAGSNTPTTQASTACPSTLDTTKPWQVGCDFAATNGFTNGVSNRTVSIQIGNGSTGIPVSGVSPSKYFVSATVTEQIPTFFSAVLRQTAMNVTARSTVGVYGSGGGGCVYVLDPSADKAFNMSGANFTTGCGIYVNSNKSDAGYMTGGVLSMNGSANLNIVGNMGWSGGIICGHTPPTLPSCVDTGASSVTNPFSGMTAPTVGSSCSNLTISGGNSNTVNPGTYCAITVNGGNNILFSSGIYVVKTGSLTISGGNFSSTATNVMFYFPPTNTTGKINITGGNMVWNGLAPGNGADGFVFWAANSTADNITGGNYSINGVTYLPNSALTYMGGNGTQQTVVADTLTVTGGNINSPASSGFFTGSGGGANGAYVVE